MGKLVRIQGISAEQAQSILIKVDKF